MAAADLRRRVLHHPRGRFAMILFLLSIWTVRSGSVRPTEHGLTYERDPGPASPEMAAFFGGRPDAVELPEAENATDQAWRMAPPAPPQRTAVAGGGRARSAMLAAGVVCGVVGAALLVAAAVAFAAHARRSRPETGPCPVLSLGRRSTEIRLGSGR